MTGVTSRIVDLIPWLPTAVAALAAAWAVFALRRAPRRDRQDRRSAVLLSGVLAAIVGFGATAFLIMFGLGWGGRLSEALAPGLLLGIAVGSAVLCSSIATYAVVARPRIGAAALAGVIAGPVLLGVTTQLAVSVQHQASYAIWTASRRASDVEAGRIHEALSISISDAHAATLVVHDPDGTTRVVVQSVRLSLAVRTTEPLTLGVGTQGPRAWYYPNDSVTSGFDTPVPLDPPFAIPAGETTFLISDSYPAADLERWPAAPRPGRWTLSFSFLAPGLMDRIFESVEFDLPGSGG